MIPSSFLAQVTSFSETKDRKLTKAQKARLFIDPHLWSRAWQQWLIERYINSKRNQINFSSEKIIIKKQMKRLTTTQIRLFRKLSWYFRDSLMKQSRSTGDIFFSFNNNFQAHIQIYVHIKHTYVCAYVKCQFFIKLCVMQNLSILILKLELRILSWIVNHQTFDSH